MKKLPITPKSRLVSAIRRQWAWSRERAKYLKEFNGICPHCLMPKKKCEVEVHHLKNISWDVIIDLIRELVLNAECEVVCRDCHKNLTKEQNASRAKAKASQKKQHIH
jgi:hypothetical protein